MISVNLTGTFLTVKHAVRAMLDRGGSIIVTDNQPTVDGNDGADTLVGVETAERADVVMENFMEELGGERTHVDIMLQFLEEVVR